MKREAIVKVLANVLGVINAGMKGQIRKVLENIPEIVDFVLDGEGMTAANLYYEIEGKEKPFEKASIKEQTLYTAAVETINDLASIESDAPAAEDGPTDAEQAEKERKAKTPNDWSGLNSSEGGPIPIAQ